MPAPTNMMVAYAVNAPLKVGGKDRWKEIGVAFNNDNGSVTINLEALPINGKIVLMKPKDKTEGGN